MIFEFQINNDNLYPVGKTGGVTENVNTYICKFEIESEYTSLPWFAVFKTDEVETVVPLSDNECRIPYEVLNNPGVVKVGCFATNFSETDLKRACTNFVSINITEGAFSVADAPDIPEPSVWEQIVLKTVPKIGDNGNWFIYDVATGQYIDTGYSSQGEGVKYAERAERAERDADGNIITDTYANKSDLESKADKSELVSKADKSDVETLNEYVVNEIQNIGIDINTKVDKPTVRQLSDSAYTFNLDTAYNTITRLGECKSISFMFGDGEYEDDYITELSFDSGSTPTSIDYTDSGIIVWKGTDCTYDDIPLFIPSANTHYDIIIYFNGSKFVGLVNAV